MNWKILGIEPTKDKAAIRKAYSEKVKECHPEEHPEEFQALQNAYRAALKYADQKEQKISQELLWTVTEENKPQEKVEPQEEERSQEKETIKKTVMLKAPQWNDRISSYEYICRMNDMLEQFLQKLDLFLKDGIGRNEIGSWKYFLENDRFELLYAQARFWYELTVRIMPIKSGLPAGIRYYVYDMAEWNMEAERAEREKMTAFLLDALELDEEARAEYQVIRSDSSRGAMFSDLLWEDDKKQEEVQNRRIETAIANEKREKKRDWLWTAVLWVFVVAITVLFIWSTEYSPKALALNSEKMRKQMTDILYENAQTEGLPFEKDGPEIAKGVEMWEYAVEINGKGCRMNYYNIPSCVGEFVAGNEIITYRGVPEGGFVEVERRTYQEEKQ